MKIKDLPIENRPREKALKYGFDSLSDIELIAILLRTGTRECNAVQLADNVLSFTGGLNGLMQSNYHSLIKINGVKNAKALLLTSLITIYQRVNITYSSFSSSSIEVILEKYERRILTDKQEKMILLVLDRNEEIIKETIIGIGNGSGVSFYYREIFKEIYLNNGYGFYLIHTHPNSISYPSKADIYITNELKRRSKRIGLTFKEHYVIGKDGYTGIFEFLKKNMN